MATAHRPSGKSSWQLWALDWVHTQLWWRLPLLYAAAFQIDTAFCCLFAKATHFAQVADWVAARAVAIDRASGQVGRAAELLAQGDASGQTENVQQLQSVLTKGVHIKDALSGTFVQTMGVCDSQAQRKLELPVGCSV